MGARAATALRRLLAALFLLAAADALRLAAGDLAARRESFGLALALDPGSPSIRLRRARSLLRGARRDAWARALADLDLAARAAPDRSEIHRLRAEVLGALGREAEADRAAERAFALEPLREAVARTAAERALDRDPALAGERFRVANLADPSRTGESMLRLFLAGAPPSTLRACIPDHPEARVLAGATFLDLGMPGAAAEQLAAADGAGDPAKRLRLLGRAALLLGDVEGAERAFRSAAEWGGAEPVAAVLAAAREAGDPAAGIEVLDRIAADRSLRPAAEARLRLEAEAAAPAPRRVP